MLFWVTFYFCHGFLSSCAPSARIPVLKPAEINLRGIDKIVVGDINGNIGPSVADLLTSRLFESDKFTVVDRQNLDRKFCEGMLEATLNEINDDAFEERGDERLNKTKKSPLQ